MLYIYNYNRMNYSLIYILLIQPDSNLLFVDKYNLDKYDEYNLMNIIKDSLFIYYNSTLLEITKLS